MISLASFVSTNSALPVTNHNDFNLRDEDYESENDFEMNLEKWNRFKMDEIITVNDDKNTLIKPKSNDTNNNHVDKRIAAPSSDTEKVSNEKLNFEIKENFKVCSNIVEEEIDESNPFFDDIVSIESTKINKKK